MEPLTGGAPCRVEKLLQMLTSPGASAPPRSSRLGSFPFALAVAAGFAAEDLVGGALFEEFAAAPVFAFA